MGKIKVQESKEVGKIEVQESKRHKTKAHKNQGHENETGEDKYRGGSAHRQRMEYGLERSMRIEMRLEIR